MGELLQGPRVQADGVRRLVPRSCKVHLLEAGEPLIHLLLGAIGEEEANLTPQVLADLVQVLPVLAARLPAQRHHHHFVLPEEDPAVLPGVPHVLQLVVPHVGHGEDEDVFVGVHASPQLSDQRLLGLQPLPGRPRQGHLAVPLGLRQPLSTFLFFPSPSFLIIV